jgi:hypothetical protein
MIVIYNAKEFKIKTKYETLDDFLTEEYKEAAIHYNHKSYKINREYFLGTCDNKEQAKQIVKNFIIKSGELGKQGRSKLHKSEIQLESQDKNKD